ncbi:hypothetical protein [Sphaerotilus sp.]|uniref:hypothetical protein n=1 Tax=Sphaerotilus sp. TaxID=2093942 RepID=UPI0025E7A638|nr:hypothetical protein [Sphaerotilus sp.]
MKIDNLNKYTELQPKNIGDINNLYWLLIIIISASLMVTTISGNFPEERVKLATLATSVLGFLITLLLLAHKHNEDYKKDMVNLSSVLFKNYTEHRKIYLEKLSRFETDSGVDLEKLYLKLFPRIQIGEYSANISPLLAELDAHTENINNILAISSKISSEANEESHDPPTMAICNTLTLKGVDLLQLKLSIDSLSSAIQSIKKIIGTTKSNKLYPEILFLEIFRSAHSVYVNNNSDLESLEKSLEEVTKARKALGTIRETIETIINGRSYEDPLRITSHAVEDAFNEFNYHKITPLIEEIIEEMDI